MARIERTTPPTNDDIELFLEKTNFHLPSGFMEFYKETNGADISGNEMYVMLWPLTGLIKSNEDYKVTTYAPDFFVFGSNGGGTAYAIEKATGHIFEIPFIGMSKEEAVFRSKSLNEFIASI